MLVKFNICSGNPKLSLNHLINKNSSCHNLIRFYVHFKSFQNSIVHGDGPALPGMDSAVMLNTEKGFEGSPQVFHNNLSWFMHTVCHHQMPVPFCIYIRAPTEYLGN